MDYGITLLSASVPDCKPGKYPEVMMTMKRKKPFLLFLGGSGLLIATFLPWVIYSSAFGNYYLIDRGYEGNGIITGGIGLLFLVGLVIRKGELRKSDFIAGNILAALASVILLYNVSDVIYSATHYTESGAATDFGYGLCLSVIGVILIFIGNTLNAPAFNDVPPHNESGV